MVHNKTSMTMSSFVTLHVCCDPILVWSKVWSSSFHNLNISHLNLPLVDQFQISSLSSKGPLIGVICYNTKDFIYTIVYNEFPLMFKILKDLWMVWRFMKMFCWKWTIMFILVFLTWFCFEHLFQMFHQMNMFSNWFMFF
jgi:hypothetical protein